MRNIQIFFILFLIHYIFSSECSDFEEIKKSSCYEIIIDDEHYCNLSGDVCTQYDKYSDCVEYTGSNSDLCSLITPSNNPSEYKCEIINNQCKPTKRICSEFISGDCTQLDPGDADKKRCYLNLENENKCEAHYKNCEDINNEEECIVNRPIENDDSDSLQNCIWDKTSCKKYSDCTDYTGTIDEDICKLIKPKESPETKKCNKVDNLCKPVDKTCEDFTESCDSHVPSENTDNNKRCVLLDGKCREIFKKCELYTGNNQTICNTIMKPYKDDGSIDTSNKCLLEGGNCKTKPKSQCSDFNGDETNCLDFVPSGDLKICVYINKECKEEYKNCEIINNQEASIKNANVCKNIKLYNEKTSIDYNKICVFDTTNGCDVKTLVKCEDYIEGYDKEYCTSINLGGNKKCAFINSKCIEQPSSCENYEENDKKICESIVLNGEVNLYNRCFLEKDETCTIKQKICSDYSGQDEIECKKYRAVDLDKICSISNGKCIEKYVETQYKYCSDYIGKSKEICESIIPYDTDGDTQLDSYKCVYDKDIGCIRESKKCEDAKDIYECNKIIPTDTLKHCLYYNGECTEQYINCGKYSENETVISDVCTSIKQSSFVKCKFNEGSPKGTCSNDENKCSNYDVKLISAQCESIIPSNKGKKCKFSSNICEEVTRTCLELANTPLNEDICSGLNTSDSNKKCSLKSDKSGCEEVNKSEEEKANSSGNNSNEENPSGKDSNGENGGNSDQGNFGGKKYLDKLLIIVIICLLY